MSGRFSARTLAFLIGAVVVAASQQASFGVDCNTNGVDDAADIAAGTSADCNSNAVPDECDHLAAYQLGKLVASNPVFSNQIGSSSVAIDGDTVMVGSVNDDDPLLGVEAGCALVFVRSGGAWTEQAKLVSGDRGQQEEFGASVSISGDTAVVGCPGDNGPNTPLNDRGAAYVFIRSGGAWCQQVKLVAPDPQEYHFVGRSVALDGDTVIIGALGDDDAGADSGAAYVFVRSGGSWTQQAKLIAADATDGDYFGWRVALDGDTAVIGASGDDDGGSESGSAYVFVRNGTTWSQQAKLTAADAAADDRFGERGVALSGDTALIAAIGNDDAGSFSGSAYVFVRSGTVWSQQAKLVASDAAAGDYFGHNVALRGDVTVIGAWLEDSGFVDSGSAYLFRRSGSIWTQQAKLLAPDGAAGDQFGSSVATDGEVAVMGSPRDDNTVNNSGSAYVFRLQPPPVDCNGNDVLDECDISANTSDDCNNNVVPDECEADFDGDGVIDNCDGDMDDDGLPNAADLCNLTPAGAGVQANGTLRADLDGDCDVDLVDFSIMQGEFTGPLGGP